MSNLVGHVVGENLRRLREARQLTQAELSRLLRDNGLPWARTQVAGLESGQRDGIGLASLVLLSNSLNVPITAFFEGDGDVQLSKEVVVSRARLCKVFAGQRRRLQ